MEMDMDMEPPAPNSESNSVQQSSTSHASTGGSSTSATSTTHQSSLLDLLKNEIEEKRYWSTTRCFIEHFAHANTSSASNPLLDYRRILEARNRGITSAPRRNTYSSNSIEWPKTGSPESRYYKPLTALIQSIKESGPFSSADINFFPYDRQMRDSPDGSWVLKPDGLGAPTHDKQVAWKDVKLAIEVKENNSLAFLQAASYARAILAARPGLQYAVIITFNHRQLKLQYHIFSHSCVSSCVPLSITTVGGYRSFVRITMAFLSSLGANEDSSQDSSSMLIPGHLLQIKQVLTQRTCIIGRATRVVKGCVVRAVENQEPDEDQDYLSSAVSIDEEGETSDDIPGETTLSEASPAKHGKGAKRAGALIPHSRKRLSIRYMSDHISAKNIGDEIIIKDSWPPVADATKEFDILTKNKGTWGLAQIYTGYQTVPYRLRPVCAPAGARLGKECTEEEKQREAIEEVEDARLQAPPMEESDSTDPSGSATIVLESSIPLARTHVRLVFKTEGEPLTAVMDDNIRVRAILDAIIGHFCCFEAGSLHGDISIGNVLYMPKSLGGTLPPRFKNLGWKDWRGMLIDFDLAVHWEIEAKSALTQSGTLPFTSLHLLSVWKVGSTCARLPVDDLESFSWLWLWTLLCIGRKQDNLNNGEKDWLSQLEGGKSYSSAHAAKAVILSDMGGSFKRRKDYPRRQEEYRLFLDWYNICEAHRCSVLDEGDPCMQNGSARPRETVIEEEFEELYKKFINRGIIYMNKGSGADVSALIE